MGDRIEIMKPDGSNVAVEVLGMYDEEGRSVESCPHSKQMIDVALSAVPERYDILRVRLLTLGNLWLHILFHRSAFP